jgi:hypothetical protein
MFTAAGLKNIADDLYNLVTVDGVLREYLRDIEMRHDIGVENISEPRKADDWDVRPVGNLPEVHKHVDAVHDTERHPNVEQNEVGTTAPQSLERSSGEPFLLDNEPCPPEDFSEQPTDQVIILDIEHVPTH